jgi:hypothetical protein
MGYGIFKFKYFITKGLEELVIFAFRPGLTPGLLNFSLIVARST